MSAAITSAAPARFSVAAWERLAVDRADAAVWQDATGVTTWREFGVLVRQRTEACRARGVRPGAVVVTPGESRLESLAWLLAVALCGGIAAPLRAARRMELAIWRESVAIDWLVDLDQLEAGPGGTSAAAASRLLAELHTLRAPGLILATGGTTGAPKLLLHHLDRLLGAGRTKTGRPALLLPLMRFDHIGGLDMVWRALATGQVIVAPPENLDPLAVAATVARFGVEIMPATPSFLNLLLLSRAHREHDLRSLQVVPYGAEPMPASLLARLQAELPEVAFLQRFGSSETGALPARSTPYGLLLDLGPQGSAWKVIDGELWIRSETRALGYLAGDNGRLLPDGWFRTGDLAREHPDGSIEVLGRQSELINVGGEKVQPVAVESVLLEHPDVCDCRVYGLANALLGQTVAAEVVWRGVANDPLVVKETLRTFAASRLARHQLPSHVRLVAAVATTRTHKKARPAS